MDLNEGLPALLFTLRYGCAMAPAQKKKKHPIKLIKSINLFMCLCLIQVRAKTQIVTHRTAFIINY
jgi:hypothetical protein